MAKQKGLFPKKGLVEKNGMNWFAANQHLNRGVEPEKPHNALSSSQFVSQLGHPRKESLLPRSTQLPMFMNSKEIGQHYQVLDGDREGVYDEDGYFSGNEENDHEVLSRKYDEATTYGAAGTTSDPDYLPESVKNAPKPQFGAFEFDQPGLDPYEHVADGHPSLADSIRQHGVEKPITLEAPKWSAQYDGSQGKPQILGGHHRYAVMREERPNDLMPVTFRNDFWEAKSDKDYR